MENKPKEETDKTEKSAEDYFNQMAGQWDENSTRHQIAQNAARAIHKKVLLSKDSAVLDFGCGTGLVSFFFYPFVKKLEGVDSSAGMVEQFNKKAREQNFSNAGARVMDIDHEELPPDQYDIIVSSMVFHHIESPKDLLPKLYHSLRKGGVLAMADLDQEDGTFHPPEAEGVRHHGFLRQEMEDWFKSAGFNNVSTSTVMQIEREKQNYSVFLCVGKKEKSE